MWVSPAGTAGPSLIGEDAASLIADAMFALSAPSRVQILGCLLDGPLAVGEITALLGMEQFGRALASFDARLSPVDSVAGLRRGLRDNKVPVWLPTRMTLGAADVPATWDVTSDSLAAWLAGRLGARRLVLMKQVELPREPA